MFYVFNISIFKKDFLYLHLMQALDKFDQYRFRYYTYLCFEYRITTERVHVQMREEDNLCFQM